MLNAAIRTFLLALFAQVFGATIAAGAHTPANPIYVDTKATDGDGSATSPWVGWDTAITWTPNVPYTFRAGWYAYSKPPGGWSQSNMLLLGIPGAVLKCAACTDGAVVAFRRPVGPYGLANIRFENFIIDGGGTTPEGLFVHATRSAFDNIRVRNVTQNGFHLTLNVLNTFTNPKVTDAMDFNLVSMPVVAMLIDGSSSANTVINPVFEGHTVNPSVTPANAVGLKLAGQALQNVTIGGTMEGLAVGIALCSDPADENCVRNTFIGTDLESNSEHDLVMDAAFANQFNNLLALSDPNPQGDEDGPKNIEIHARARANQFIGGTLTTLFERGQYTTFMNTSFAKLTEKKSFDSHKIQSTFIGVRDRSASGPPATFNRLPATTVTVSGLSKPLAQLKHTDYTVPSSVLPPVTSGSTVLATYEGGDTPGYMVTSYVNASGNVVIRWTLLDAAALAPPAGTYRVTVLQR